jgi:hypothetical protein
VLFSRGRILGRNWDKSFKSFPHCYSHSPLLTDFKPSSPLKESSLKLVCNVNIFLKNKLFLRWAGPRPNIPFPPDLILYVNLVAMGPVHLSPVTWPQASLYMETSTLNIMPNNLNEIVCS